MAPLAKTGVSKPGCALARPLAWTLSNCVHRSWCCHQSRLDSWPQHYPWIDPAGYEYFRTRLGQARRDVEHGLAITLQHYTTRAGQERMLEILQFKLDILWSMLDAMSMAYELNRPPYHSVTQERVWHKGIAL